MEDFRYAAYKNMLISVADVVDEDITVLESMKFRCDQIIKGREREQIKSSIHLWTALEKREYLGPSNTSFLKDILKSCSRGQMEALNIVENYERLNGMAQGGVAGQLRPNQNSQAPVPQIIYLQDRNDFIQHVGQNQLGPDISKEITFLTKSLGRDWKFFIRELGVPESDIEVITSDYRSTREQVQQCFLVWQDMCREQATKEKLVHALRAVKRKDLADTLEEGIY